jgi:hypothetical protein
MSRSLFYFVLIAIGLIVGGAAGFMLGSGSAKPENAALIKLDAATLQQETTQIKPSPQNKISFTIRTQKSCYVVNEPVKTWVEMANLSDGSLRVFKTLPIFTGGILQDVTPFVNGKPNKAQPTALKQPSAVESDYYATLLPNESVVTYIPNFLDLVFDLSGQGKITAGQYDLALRYKNLLPNVLNQMTITPEGTVQYEVFADQPVWTGILESNHLSITLVDTPEACGTPAV